MKRLLPLVLMVVLLIGSTNFASAQDNSSDQAKKLIDQLPDKLKALYANTASPILPSAYDNFKAVPTPWRWCHSESYQGNPWRVSVTNELKRLVEVYKTNGLVSEFEISDANNDVALQNSQIRAFIDKKCSIITSIAGSATGLNDAIEAAFKAGIPFITAAGAVTSPYAINADENYNRWGFDMASAIGEAFPNGANVLLVEGIAGHPIVVMERAGADEVFTKNTKLKIVGAVNGNWTPSVTKSVVLQYLATNPAQIDAVWTTGSESRLVAEAFKEAGRPQPLITGSITGDALGYWKANPEGYKFTGNAVLPAPTAQAVFRIGVRILSGQHPKLNTIMFPLAPVKAEDLGKWYKSCMMPDSGSIFPVPPVDRLTEEDLNGYFTNGEAIKFYDYGQTPDPCGATK
jgi:ribose transport system substrate-binding protein